MRDIYRSDNISVVVDANILIDLFEINQLNILFQIFDHVYIPQIIFEDELPIAIQDKLNLFPFKFGLIEKESGLQIYHDLIKDKSLKRLSKYDRLAISIAFEKAIYCNSNDALVRRACEKYDISTTGLLGVLGRAYYQSILPRSAVEEALARLTSDETTCYIDSDLVETFKKEIFFAP